MHTRRQVYTFEKEEWLSGREGYCDISKEHRTIDNNIPINPNMIRSLPSQCENSNLFTYWTDSYRTLGIGTQTVDSLLTKDLQPDYTLLKEK